MFATDRAGIGTQVEVRFDDGASLVCCILGEWDREEVLHIVSSGSQLAQALQGLHVGDRVNLPDGQGLTRGGVLEGVHPLPDTIRAWAAETVAAQG